MWVITENLARELTRLPKEPYTSQLGALQLVERGGLALVFAAAADSDIVVWNVETGAQVAVIEGHTSQAVSLALSPDQRRLLSGGNDNAVILWDIDPASPTFGKELHRFSGQPTGSTSGL